MLNILPINMGLIKWDEKKLRVRLSLMYSAKFDNYYVSFVAVYYYYFPHPMPYSTYKVSLKYV